MKLSEELRNKQSRDNRALLDRAADRIDELEAGYRKQSEGEWVHGENDMAHCSVCGNEEPDHSLSPFCPNCGANMDWGD